MHVRVDDDRGPAPAQQLGLDQGVLQPQWVRLELGQGRGPGPILARKEHAVQDLYRGCPRNATT